MSVELDTLQSDDREILRPMRTTERRAFFGMNVGVSSIVFFSLLASGCFLGTHTKYCPWSHLMRDTAVCVVLDQHGDTVLIQHAELDINRYYLELRQGQEPHYFKMPEGITKLAPSGYSAKLIAGDSSAILLDGRFTQLQNTQPSF